MNICYYFNENGYFLYLEPYGETLPPNATLTPAPQEPGFIAKWNGDIWEQIENYKGEKGYLNGQAFEIKEYGPYPRGWSQFAPTEICYTYDAAGYYAEAGTVYDRLLPHNSTLMAPKVKKGYIPHWNGSAWKNIQNHQREKGYLHGQAFEIKEYGPYPVGWSATPPKPTPPEIKKQRIDEIGRQLKELDESAQRAMLELLDPATSPEDRAYSEAKISEINQAKQPLRAERSALEADAGANTDIKEAVS